MSVKNNFITKFQMRWVLFTLVVIITLVLSGCSPAKQAKTYKVGVLSGLDAFAPAIDAFKSKMTALGYVEGQNISYDVQSTNIDLDTYRRMTKKFVDDKVDLIFVFPTEAALEAKIGTEGTNIPVVFALAFTDVAGMDLIKSIRVPGGNISGVRYPSSDIASKRLEILIEMTSNPKRIFVPYLKGYASVPGQLDLIRAQAATRGIQLVEFAATSPQELQAELDRLTASKDAGIDAILMLAEPLAITPNFYAVLGKFSYAQKIPIGGALMNVGGSYGSIFALRPNPKIAGEQSALLADKIFRGTAAGAIPVVTSESDFEIDYKAAQALGVTIPEGLLKQASKIIR